jgi:hypothetical protein
MTRNCNACNMDEGWPICLRDERCPHSPAPMPGSARGAAGSAQQQEQEPAIPDERSAAFLDWWHAHGRKLCITPECAEYVFEAGRAAAIPGAEDGALPALRALVRTILTNAQAFDWSLQGMGMLRLHLPGAYRLHVWDSRYRVPNVSMIHDHLQWGLHSTIIAGELTNRRYAMDADGEPHLFRTLKPGYGYYWKDDAQRCGLRALRAITYGPGGEYEQEPAEIHQSDPLDGTVTLMHKRPTADESARVFWPDGEQWVSAEPRRATPEEVADITGHALERWFGGSAPATSAQPPSAAPAQPEPVREVLKALYNDGWNDGWRASEGPPDTVDRATAVEKAQTALSAPPAQQQEPPSTAEWLYRVDTLWEKARGNMPDGMCGWFQARKFAALLENDSAGVGAPGPAEQRTDRIPLPGGDRWVRDGKWWYLSDSTGHIVRHATQFEAELIDAVLTASDPRAV